MLIYEYTNANAENAENLLRNRKKVLTFPEFGFTLYFGNDD